MAICFNNAYQQGRVEATNHYCGTTGWLVDTGSVKDSCLPAPLGPMMPETSVGPRADVEVNNSSRKPPKSPCAFSLSYWNFAPLSRSGIRLDLPNA